MKLELRSNKVKVLREEGLIPGVVYGKGIDSTSIQLPYRDFLSTLSEYGLSRTFPVSLGRKKHIVYFKDVQRDPMNVHHFLHFDLQKVTSDDTITSHVPLHFIGRELVEKNNIMLTFDTTELTVEYKVGQGVSSLDVDVSGMEIGDYLHVSDLVIPEGLTVDNDPEDIVAKLAYAKVHAEADELDPDAEEVEVEAIKQSAE